MAMGGSGCTSGAAVTHRRNVQHPQFAVAGPPCLVHLSAVQRYCHAVSSVAAAHSGGAYATHVATPRDGQPAASQAHVQQGGPLFGRAEPRAGVARHPTGEQQTSSVAAPRRMEHRHLDMLGSDGTSIADANRASNTFAPNGVDGHAAAATAEASGLRETRSCPSPADTDRVHKKQHLVSAQMHVAQAGHVGAFRERLDAKSHPGLTDAETGAGTGPLQASGRIAAAGERTLRDLEASFMEELTASSGSTQMLGATAGLDQSLPIAHVGANRASDQLALSGLQAVSVACQTGHRGTSFSGQLASVQQAAPAQTLAEMDSELVGVRAYVSRQELTSLLEARGWQSRSKQAEPVPGAGLEDASMQCNVSRPVGIDPSTLAVLQSAVAQVTGSAETGGEQQEEERRSGQDSAEPALLNGAAAKPVLSAQATQTDTSQCSVACGTDLDFASLALLESAAEQPAHVLQGAEAATQMGGTRCQAECSTDLDLATLALLEDAAAEGAPAPEGTEAATQTGGGQSQAACSTDLDLATLALLEKAAAEAAAVPEGAEATTQTGGGQSQAACSTDLDLATLALLESAAAERAHVPDGAEAATQTGGGQSQAACSTDLDLAGLRLLESTAAELAALEKAYASLQERQGADIASSQREVACSTVLDLQSLAQLEAVGAHECAAQSAVVATQTDKDEHSAQVAVAEAASQATENRADWPAVQVAALRSMDCAPVVTAGTTPSLADDQGDRALSGPLVAKRVNDYEAGRVSLGAQEPAALGGVEEQADPLQASGGLLFAAVAVQTDLVPSQDTETRGSRFWARSLASLLADEAFQVPRPHAEAQAGEHALSAVGTRSVCASSRRGFEATERLAIRVCILPEHVHHCNAGASTPCLFCPS